MRLSLVLLTSLLIISCSPSVDQGPDLIKDGETISTPKQWREYCLEHGEGDPAC